MCLIMNKTRVREKFIHQWEEVYVSAIVEYGTSSNKKGLRTLMNDVIVDKEGDCSGLIVNSYISFMFYVDDVMMQVTALKVLATALGKGDKSLIYFYKEHHVSRLIMCIISFKFMMYNFIADGGSWGCMSASSSPEPTLDCSFSG